MRDYQEVIIRFVRIVEKYPEIYDSGLDTYRTDYAEKSWEKIAQTVRTELQEECTVEEIKSKWKGIRSSFNRFKKKYFFKSAPCKKYYLYDSLKFLEPFTRPKGMPSKLVTGGVVEDYNNSLISDDDDKVQVDYDPELIVWEEQEIKPEFEDNLNINDHELNCSRTDQLNINISGASQSAEQSSSLTDVQKENKVKKRKHEEERDESCDSEDLLFFKCIIPDIKDFSAKEKRRLKVEILKLIDTIEDDRKRSKHNNMVTSSKSNSNQN